MSNLPLDDLKLLYDECERMILWTRDYPDEWTTFRHLYYEQHSPEDFGAMLFSMKKMRLYELELVAMSHPELHPKCLAAVRTAWLNFIAKNIDHIALDEITDSVLRQLHIIDP